MNHQPPGSGFIIWLEQYLLGSHAAMIIISHDRVFLNRVVERILELENGDSRNSPAITNLS